MTNVRKHDLGPAQPVTPKTHPLDFDDGVLGYMFNHNITLTSSLGAYLAKCSLTSRRPRVILCQWLHIRSFQHVFGKWTIHDAGRHACLRNQVILYNSMYLFYLSCTFDTCTRRNWSFICIIHVMHVPCTVHVQTGDWAAGGTVHVAQTSAHRHHLHPSSLHHRTDLEELERSLGSHHAQTHARRNHHHHHRAT